MGRVAKSCIITALLDRPHPLDQQSVHSIINYPSHLVIARLQSQLQPCETIYGPGISPAYLSSFSSLSLAVATKGELSFSDAPHDA